MQSHSDQANLPEGYSRNGALQVTEIDNSDSGVTIVNFGHSDSCRAPFLRDLRPSTENVAASALLSRNSPG